VTKAARAALTGTTGVEHAPKAAWSPSPVTAAPWCGQEHGGRGTPRRFLIDDRYVSLGELRLMDPLVQPVSLLPHLLQRDLATLTAQVNLDAAEPVTRVFDDEHRLRAGGHCMSLPTRRRHASPHPRTVCMSRS
jgi:hypothetical protein